MSLGSWDPSAQSAAAAVSLTPALITELAAYSSDDHLDDLTSLLNGDRSQVLSGLMHLPAADWEAHTEGVESATLLHLIRFFAVAESLPGWEAGERSPVIPLARTLRRRGEKLERDLLLWLREVSDNRFLPYGPL